MIRINIFIDDREGKLCQKAERMIPGIETKRLEVGDIVCNERGLAVERKEVKDYAQSVIKKRIYRQLENMQENYDHCYLIIVGDFKTVFQDRYIKFTTKQLIGSLASIAARHRVSVIRVDNHSQYLQLSKALIEKSDGKKVDETYLNLVDHRSKNVNVNILCAIPGIGAKYAQRVLDHYDSVGEICNASVEDISKIKGIGKKRAEKIKEWLR